METTWTVLDGDGRTIAAGSDEKAVRQCYEDYAYAVRRGEVKAPLRLVHGALVVEENLDPNDVWARFEPCSSMALQGAAAIVAAAATGPSTSLAHAEACLEALEHFPEKHRHWLEEVRAAVEQKRRLWQP